MAKLTAAARKKIPAKDFALGKGRYPIEDEAHARNAEARVSQYGTPSEKARVRAAVRRKYPSMGHEDGDGAGERSRHPKHRNRDGNMGREGVYSHDQTDGWIDRQKYGRR
jgi:hypothetical protein